MAIRFLYAIFLGVLVSLFIGLGVAAFYKAPKAPEYPTILESSPVTKDGTPVEGEESKLARTRYDAEHKAYQKASATYNQNVSMISLVAAVLVLIIALTLAERIKLISDGLLFGGILTLLYSIIRGFMGENEIYRFLITAVGLIIAMGIGYIKFIKPDTAHSKKQ